MHSLIQRLRALYGARVFHFSGAGAPASHQLTLARDLVQRGMEQVRGGVVAADVVAAGFVHFGNHFRADPGLAANHFADVRDQPGSRAADIRNFNLEALAANVAGIGHLAARLDVKAGLGQDHFNFIAKLGFGYALAFDHQRENIPIYR